VTEQTIAGARAGDEDAFRALTDPYQRELQLHIYRIVGSAHDAEDLLQETLLAAWRGLEGFEGRASVRAWLYRIATNRSLDALRAHQRRPEEQRMTQMPEPTRWNEPVWLQPYSDVLLEGIADEAPGPEARYETKEAIALAFIVGLQHLPPQQRAVLVLRDVLGYRAGEVAEMLDTTEASVNNLLRRARVALESRLPTSGRERAPLPNSRLEREIVGRFAETVENGDIDGMVALLTDDAWVTMPPLPHAYQGHEAIAAFLRGSAERRVAAAGGDPGQRTARVRLLHVGVRDRGRPCLRAVRADPGGRPHRRDHMVCRQQRVSAVRPPAHAAIAQWATTRAGPASAYEAEERAELLDEQLGLFKGRKVATPVELIPVAQVGEAGGCPAA
jgi:RNA polymerase sigma-70 factor (TIGR02960 family)